MRNLIQKIGKRIAPIVLAGAGIIGCATYPNALEDSVKSEPNVIKPTTRVYPETSKNSKKNLKNLGNGYFARNYKSADIIDLINSVLLSEVILKKTDNGYVRINTRIYGSSKEEIWNSTFDQSCILADANNDYILEEDEVKDLLDMTYEAIQKRNNEIIWVEE